MYGDLKTSCENVNIGDVIHASDDKSYYCASKKDNDRIEIGGNEEKFLKIKIGEGSTHPFTGEVLQTGIDLVFKTGNNALIVVPKGKWLNITNDLFHLSN